MSRKRLKSELKKHTHKSRFLNRTMTRCDVTRGQHGDWSLRWCPQRDRRRTRSEWKAATSAAERIFSGKSQQTCAADNRKGNERSVRGSAWTDVCVRAGVMALRVEGAWFTITFSWRGKRGRVCAVKAPWGQVINLRVEITAWQFTALRAPNN